MSTLPHPLAPMGEDLVGAETLKASVRERYRDVIGRRTVVAEELYAAEELERLPRAAVEAALGVGHPEVLDERVFSIDDLARYPLFPPTLIENMRRLLTPERQQAVARSVVFTARKAG